MPLNWNLSIGMITPITLPKILPKLPGVGGKILQRKALAKGGDPAIELKSLVEDVSKYFKERGQIVKRDVKSLQKFYYPMIEDFLLRSETPEERRYRKEGILPTPLKKAVKFPREKWLPGPLEQPPLPKYEPETLPGVPIPAGKPLTFPGALPPELEARKPEQIPLPEYKPEVLPAKLPPELEYRAPKIAKIPSKVEITPKLVKAREKALESELSSLNEQMRILEKEKTLLTARGIPTREVDERLINLSRRYNYADSQIAELMVGQPRIEELKKEVAQMKVGDIIRGEIKAERIGVKAGIVETKAEARENLIRRRERFRQKAKVTKMLGDIRSIDTRHMRPEFAEPANEIKEVLDFAKPTKKTLSKLHRIGQYLKENPEAQLPDYVMDNLARMEKLNRSDLTYDQLESLHGTVLHYNHLNKIKNQLIYKRVAKDANTVIEQAVTNINKRKLKTVTQEYDIDIREEAPRSSTVAQIFKLKSWNPELVCEILDKEENGIIREILSTGIDEGVTESLRYAQDIEMKWGEFIKESGIDVEDWSEYFDKNPANVDWQTLTLPSGKTMKISKGIRITFYMHSLNAKNEAHLLQGGYAFERTPTNIRAMTEEDSQAILDTVTDEEKRVAEALKNIVYDPQHAAINEKYITLNGYSLGREENYLRIKVAGVSLPKEVKQLHRQISKQALEEMGMLKERRNAKNPILIEDIFKATYESIRNASTFIGLAVPIRDAKLLLYSERFEKQLSQIYGPAWHKYLDRYLEDVVGDMTRMDDVEKLIANMKDKATVALLGLNPFVWFYQPVSYLSASTEISSKYLARASTTKATPELLTKWSKRSPQLLERIKGGYSRDIADVGRIGAVRKHWTGRRGLSGKLMGGIRNFDTKTVIRICEACEMEQRELGHTGEELARRATKRAEEVIRKTQPTFHAKDRSEISRSRNPFVRALTMFTSQRNKNYIIQRRAIEKYGRSPKRPPDKGKLLWTLFLVGVGQYQLIRGLKKLRRKILHPREKIEEKGMTVFVRDWLGGVLGNFYGGASFSNSLASKIEKGTFSGYDMETPLSSLAGAGVDAIAEGARSMDQFITQDYYKSGPKEFQMKWKASLKRALDKSAQVLFTLKGLPYVPLREVIKGGMRYFVDPDTETFILKSTKKEAGKLVWPK